MIICPDWVNKTLTNYVKGAFLMAIVAFQGSLINMHDMNFFICTANRFAIQLRRHIELLHAKLLMHAATRRRTYFEIIFNTITNMAVRKLFSKCPNDYLRSSWSCLDAFSQVMQSHGRNVLRVKRLCVRVYVLGGGGGGDRPRQVHK